MHIHPCIYIYNLKRDSLPAINFPWRNGSRYAALQEPQFYRWERGYMRRFRSKIFYQRRKETRKGSVGSSGEAEKKKGRTSLGAYILVSDSHTEAIPSPFSASPEQRKAPSKPVSRVSQSRVKQLSAFAPSLEKEKRQVGTSPDRNVQALQNPPARERIERSRSKRTERRLYLPGGFEWNRPSSFLHLCDRVPNAPEHLLNQQADGRA